MAATGRNAEVGLAAVAGDAQNDGTLLSKVSLLSAILAVSIRDA